MFKGRKEEGGRKKKKEERRRRKKKKEERRKEKKEQRKKRIKKKMKKGKKKKTNGWIPTTLPRLLALGAGNKYGYSLYESNEPLFTILLLCILMIGTNSIGFKMKPKDKHIQQQHHFKERIISHVTHLVIIAQIFTYASIACILNEYIAQLIVQLSVINGLFGFLLIIFVVAEISELFKF